MTEDVRSTNGTPRTKVITSSTMVELNKLQPRGSMVSFHSIQYKVKLKTGPLCKRKNTAREILVDLK
jgi:hypothetical protein